MKQGISNKVRLDFWLISQQGQGNKWLLNCFLRNWISMAEPFVQFRDVDILNPQLSSKFCRQISNKYLSYSIDCKDNIEKGLRYALNA